MKDNCRLILTNIEVHVKNTLLSQTRMQIMAKSNDNYSSRILQTLYLLIHYWGNCARVRERRRFLVCSNKNTKISR